MGRRRRGLSPRMRELAVIYACGGAWPVSVAMQMMSRSDSHYGKMLRDSLSRQRPSRPPRPACPA